MAKKKDPYAEQAQQAALVSYGPQLSALTTLLRQSQEDYDTRVRQAKSARQFSVGAVDQAVPQVTQAYQGAQAAVAPGFAQGGGVEAQALQARLGEAAALARSQLAGRRVSAVEGEGASRAQAFRDLTSDRGKIQQQAQDLSSQEGAFIAKTIGDLQGQDASARADADKLAAQLNNSRGNALIGAGLLPTTDKDGNVTGATPIPGGRLDPNAPGNKKGKKWASQAAQSKAADVISGARNEAKTLIGTGASRGEIAQLLLQGAPATTSPVYDTVNGRQVRRLEPAKLPNGQPNPKAGQQVTREVPALQKVDSQLLLSAALDMEYDGHLSARNERLLHARGIQLEPLGLVTYGEYKRRLRASINPALAPDQRPGNAPGIRNSGSRPT